MTGPDRPGRAKDDTNLKGTPAAEPTEPNSVGPQTARSDARNTNGRKVTAVVVGAALIVTAAGVGFTTHRNRAMRTAAVEEAKTTCAQTQSVRSRLSAKAADAETLLAETQGRVLDDAVHTELAGAVAQAEQVPAVTDLEAGATRPQAISAREACEDVDARAEQADARLSTASDAVRLSTARFSFAEEQASATTAVDEANAALAESAGKVTDDATRQALAAAVSAVVVARDVEHAGTIDEVEAQRGTLAGAMSALGAPRQAVVESRASWQAAEDARIAAERAAAQARSRQKAAPGGSSGAASSSRSGSGSSSKSSGGGSSSKSSGGSGTGSTGGGGMVGGSRQPTNPGAEEGSGRSTY